MVVHFYLWTQRLQDSLKNWETKFQIRTILKGFETIAVFSVLRGEAIPIPPAEELPFIKINNVITLQ